MSQPRFFQDAPVISWLTWMKRRIWETSMKPKLLYRPTFLPNTMKPHLASPENAEEYSTFLSLFFMKPESQYHLHIPPSVFENLGINLTGVEIRDCDRSIIGLVFSWNSGSLEQGETGVITWLCVHPIWRKKGLADTLLHAIDYYTKANIHFFRNDGFLKGHIPPLWTESIITRNTKRTTPSSYVERYHAHKVPLETIKSKFINLWSLKKPTGIILNGETSPLIEAWELILGNSYIIVLLQPTFERKKQTGEVGCEILAWVSTWKEPSFYIEHLVDCLLYDWVEAPSTIPHIESIWKHSGQSSWSLYGLDIGTPVMQKILPLVAA